MVPSDGGGREQARPGVVVDQTALFILDQGRDSDMLTAQSILLLLILGEIRTLFYFFAERNRRLMEVDSGHAANLN